MRGILKELRRVGETVLILSHNLPGVGGFCKKNGIIEQGELIYSGPVSDIIRRAKAGTVLQVGVSSGQEQAAALLSQDPNISEVVANNGFLQVSLKDGVSDFTFVPQRLVAAGYRLTLLKEEEVNLETAFMRLTKGMVQ